MPRSKATFRSAALTPTKPAYERYKFLRHLRTGRRRSTLLSSTLWASEVIRRVRPAVQPFDIYIARPQ